jgi:hypothetical protein
MCVYAKQHMEAQVNLYTYNLSILCVISMFTSEGTVNWGEIFGGVRHALVNKSEVKHSEVLNFLVHVYTLFQIESEISIYRMRRRNFIHGYRVVVPPMFGNFPP